MVLSIHAMDVVQLAILPRVVMPPTMMLAIVVTFFVALFVPGVGVMMNYFSIPYDATRQTEHQGAETNCSERNGPV